MAGIAGILLKQKDKEVTDYLPAFETMMKKLAVSDSQLKKSHAGSSFLIGNVITCSGRFNNRFQFNEFLHVYCVIDGLIFVSDEEKSILKKKYQLNGHLSDYDLVPYLYHCYEKEIIHHITGWYNVFLVSEANNEFVLFNDRFGYLPLYYYESNEVFVFASKIECLLGSGLMSAFEFDLTSIAEHLFFNYTLSDYTFIKDIKILENATLLSFEGDKKSERKYWGVENLFDFKPVAEKESLQILNEGLNAAILKILTQSQQTLNATLTGGWDSRVVLSLLLPENKERLSLYSFGADKNDDITIPEYIAKKEHINYKSYILNEEYIANQFIPSSIDTILLSNGTRHYKRSHYLHAIKQIALNSDLLINGNFGDEVFKVAQVSGGSVISQNAIDFIGSDFNVDKTIERFNESTFLKNIKLNTNRVKEEFGYRLNLINEKTKAFDTLSKKFLYFRLEINLRKFFGAEVNSYNDYVYSFSPFIDYDFLSSLARTKYFGIHYPFNSNDLKLKMQTTLLYARLTQMNYKPLVYYNSTRGYSMHDSITALGKLKIYLKKYYKTKKIAVDGFNTKPTDEIFLNHLKQSSTFTDSHSLLVETELNNKFACDINSLVFWMNSVKHRYFNSV